MPTLHGGSHEITLTKAEFKAAAQIWLLPLKIVFSFSRVQPVLGGFETRLKLIKFGLRFFKDKRV